MSATIPLSGGAVAIVDDEDLAFLTALGPWSTFTTSTSRNTYARRTVRVDAEHGASLYMHRVLMDADRVDHINGDGLDNRRANLRAASHADNMRNARRRSDNTSGYKGVSRAGSRWVAAIHVNGRRIHLGSFADRVQAAHVYDAAAIQHFGQFARPNFPQESAA